MEGWVIALLVCLPITTLVVGIVIGFSISKKMVKKQLDKNPPINEAQIRAMYTQMGRKPTEQQIKQIMHSVKNAGNK